MALSIIQKASNSGNAVDTISATFPGAVTSGNTVLVVVAYASSGTFTSLTDDKGNTYTQSDTFTDATNSWISKTFHCGNVTNAPTIVTLTLGAGTGFGLSIGIDEAGGGVSSISDPRDGHTGQVQLTPGTGTDAAVSTNITTAANGDLIWGACISNGNGLHALAGTGYTVSNAADFGPAASVTTEWKVQGAAGSVQTTFTQQSAAAAYSFIIAVKAGGPQLGSALQAGVITLTANATIPGILIGDYTLNNGLGSMASVCNKIYVGSSQATTYTEATSTFALGNFDYGSPIAFGSPAAGSPNGRKITSTAISNGTVTASGGVLWWAAVDSANSRFLASGPVLAGASIATGQVFTLGSFAIHLPSN